MYYKRQGSEKYLGPGKVVFQDGKVVFVRHGGVFVQVSPTHLIKDTNEALGQKNDSQVCETADPKTSVSSPETVISDESDDDVTSIIPTKEHSSSNPTVPPTSSTKTNNFQFPKKGSDFVIIFIHLEVL